MKVLLCSPGYDKQEGLGGWGYRNFRAPLKKSVDTVIDFDYNVLFEKLGREGMEVELYKCIAENKPDILIHARIDNELQPRLLADLRDDFPIATVGFLSDPHKATCFEYGTIGLYDIVLNSSITMCKNAVEVGFTRTIFHPYTIENDFYYPTSAEKEHDVLFVGSASEYRAGIIRKLLENGVNIRVYGAGWNHYPDLDGISSGYRIHDEILSLYNKTKIVLDLPWNEDDETEPSMKSRFSEVAACNGLLFTKHHEDIENAFSHLTQYICFNDETDLLHKINHFLHNNDDRYNLSKAFSVAVSGAMESERIWKNSLDQIIKHIPEGKNKPQYTFQAREARIDVKPKNRLALTCMVYNGERYIEDHIKSILEQTNPNFEYLLLDDGSTDSTPDIIKKYLSDPRIKYVRQDNIGSNLKNFDKLLERCINLTDSELIAFIGSDDLLMPNKVELQLRAFDENPNIDVCYSDVYQVLGDTVHYNERLSEKLDLSLTRNNILRKLLQVNCIVFPSCMMRRSGIQKMGGFQTCFASDYHFWLRSAKFLNYHYINQPLIVYRDNEHNSSNRCDLSYRVSESKKIKEEVYNSYSILDFYPELTDIGVRQDNLAEAYFHLATSLLRDIYIPQNIVMDAYNKCLYHNPEHILAINNMLLIAVSIHSKEMYDGYIQKFMNYATESIPSDYLDTVLKNRLLLNENSFENLISNNNLEPCMVSEHFRVLMPRKTVSV